MRLRLTSLTDTLRVGWHWLLRGLRDWAEIWPIADVVIPSPRPSLAWRLLAVLLAGAAVGYTRYLYWSLASRLEVERSVLPWDDSLALLALLVAFLAGVASCRRQMIVQPESLLIPLADCSVLVALFAMAVEWLGVPASLAMRWVLALVALSFVSLALLSRLWGMWLFSIEGIRMRRESRHQASASASRAGGDLLVRILEMGDGGDARVAIRTQEGEREATLGRRVLPHAMRVGVSAGAWFLIDHPVVRWRDGEPQITAGNASYVGADPGGMPPTWVCGETVAGGLALLAHHAAVVAVARLLVALHA